MTKCKPVAFCSAGDPLAERTAFLRFLRLLHSTSSFDSAPLLHRKEQYRLRRSSKTSLQNSHLSDRVTINSLSNGVLNQAAPPLLYIRSSCLSSLASARAHRDTPYRARSCWSPQGEGQGALGLGSHGGLLRPLSCALALNTRHKGAPFEVSPPAIAPNDCRRATVPSTACAPTKTITAPPYRRQRIGERSL